MTSLKTFTIDDIRSWQPCYDPGRHLPEDWRGTALDLLAMEQIPAHDRLWVVLRDEVIDAQTLRLYAAWCARQVAHLNPDPRVTKACDVAERFALGQAAREELEAASGAAWAASWEPRVARLRAMLIEAAEGGEPQR